MGIQAFSSKGVPLGRAYSTLEDSIAKAGAPSVATATTHIAARATHSSMYTLLLGCRVPPALNFWLPYSLLRS